MTSIVAKIILLFVFLPNIALGFDCDQIPLASLVSKSDQIFIGKVVDVKVIPAPTCENTTDENLKKMCAEGYPALGRGKLKIKFELKRLFKGVDSKEKTVSFDGLLYDLVNVPLKSDWIVFAKESKKGPLFVADCYQTKPIKKIKDLELYKKRLLGILE